MRMARAWRSNQAAIALGERCKFSPRNQQLGKPPQLPIQLDATACRKEHHLSVSSRGAKSETASPFTHFCATPRHLRYASRASDESWNRRRAQVRLTCLSGRCLSSYLLFPPVPVTQQAASSFRWRKARQWLRHLKFHTDLCEERSERKNDLSRN